MKIKFPKLKLLQLASLLLLVVFLVAFRWNGLNAPFNRDEGGYAYGAWLLRRGLSPYTFGFEHKPPMVLYLFAFLQILAPNALWLPRLVGLFFTLAAVILLGLVAKMALGKRYQFPAMWLAAAVFNCAYALPFSANTEVFILLPQAALLYFAFRFQEKMPAWVWLLAGGLTAFGLLFKPVVLPVFGLSLFFWLYRVWQKTKKVKKTVPGLILFTAGGLVITGLSILPVLATGNWADFWDKVIVYNYHYSRSDQFGSSYTMSFLHLFWRDWPFVFILVGVMILLQSTFWWLWLGLFLATALGVWGAPGGHYWLSLMPYLALMLAAVLQSLWRLVKDSLGKANRRQPLVLGLFTFVLSLALVWPFKLQLTMDSPNLLWWAYGKNTPFVESPEVAAKVESLTAPDERVYVLGSEWQLMYYARRRGATAMTNAYALGIETPKKPAYQRQAIEELQQTPPALIVIAKSTTSTRFEAGNEQPLLDYLDRVLEADYQLVGGWVRDQYSLEKGYWQEPLEPEEIENCTLVVYERKD